MRKLVSCLLVVMLSSAAAAETSATPPATNHDSSTRSEANARAEDREAQPAAKKKMCKNLDAGFSHRTERVCMTAEQWEEYNRGN